MANYNEYSPEELDESTDTNNWVLIDFLNEDGEFKSFDVDVHYHNQPSTGLAGLPSLTIDVIMPLAAIDYASDPEADILTHYEGSGYEELNTEREKLIPKAEFIILTKPQIEQRDTIEQYNRFIKLR